MTTQLLEMVSESKYTDTYAYNKIAPLNTKLCLEILFWNRFNWNFCCFSFFSKISNLARKIFVKMLSMHSRPYNANNPSLSVPRTKMHGPNDRNSVGRNMLRAFGHPVVRCFDMLGVGSNLKIVKFFMQHLWMLLDTVVLWPGSRNSVASGGHAH